MVFVPSDFDTTVTVFELWSLSLSSPIVRATMRLANSSSSGSMVCGVVVGVSDSGTIFVASTWMIQQLQVERGLSIKQTYLPVS